MSERIYKNVVIEVRPKLRSANVFVTFKDCIKHPKIVLNEHSFKVVFKDKQFSFSLGELTAITSPLLSLKCSKNWLSFKFFISSETGSFKTDLLCDGSLDKNIEEKPLLTENQQYDIQCKNCEKLLNKHTLEFKRVLPLPSEKCDPSDWFCHSHGNHAVSKFSLDPKKTDAFYTPCYLHLNQENMTNLKSKDQVLVCKFCLSWLGFKCNENTQRFWFNTVNFVHDNLILSTDPVQDVYKSIKNVFKTCLLTAVRIIFTYQDSNGDKNYLLLWILEKNLNVILNAEDGRKNIKVAKTLFKFVEVDNDKLVSCWKSDNNVEVLSISKPMMIEILKLLYFYNKIFPPEYAKSNDFLISYLLPYN